MRVLGSSVLVAEAFVIFFATIVAANLTDVGAGTAWAVGGAFALACLAVCGLLRYSWAYALGWVLQLALFASGFVVTAMFFLGAVFTALWIAALRVGRKVDLLKAARAGG
jgi:Protein of unknown function (DUF4233)